MPAHDSTNIPTAIGRGTLDPCLPSGTLELVHGAQGVADGETGLSAGVARQLIVDSVGNYVRAVLYGRQLHRVLRCQRAPGPRREPRLHGWYTPGDPASGATTQTIGAHDPHVLGRSDRGSAGMAALDREEQAAELYAGLVRRVGQLQSRDHLRAEWFYAPASGGRA